MRNQVLQFFGADPVVAWLLTIALLFVLGALVLAGIDALLDRWLEHEVAKDRRRELESCLQHHPPTVVSFQDHAAKGWQKRRVS